MSLSAVEGLNLTGQGVKLSAKSNSPEKASTDLRKASKEIFFWIEKLNIKRSVTNEGHTSP